MLRVGLAPVRNRSLTLSPLRSRDITERGGRFSDPPSMLGAGFDDFVTVAIGLKRSITNCTVTGPYQDSTTNAPAFGVGPDGKHAIAVTSPAHGLVDNITDLVFHENTPRDHR
jgi:hypothetical protein